MSRFLITSLLAFYCLSGCDGLKTKLENHLAAIDRNGPIISYTPSYLIGIEKANRKMIGGPQWGNCVHKEYCFRTDSPNLTADETKKIERRLDDLKGHFVSHIVRYDNSGIGADSGQSAKILYGIYSPNGDVDRTKCMVHDQPQPAVRACFDSGWQAVRSLKTDIAERVKQDRITHIIVMSSGWNTLQQESIENYNEWIQNITAAAREEGGDDFRPLFIGLSWASDWDQWIEPVDYLNKAHDADEVGLTWGNILVHEVLLPLRRERPIPIVLIGHSFGARLLSRSIHSKTILPISSPDDGPIELFLGLQGAFSVNRFTENRGKEGQPYREFRKAAKKIILTSSEHDKAVTMAIHSEDMLAGSMHAYKETEKTEYAQYFDHIVIDREGRWERPPSPDALKVTMVDASAMVATNKPGTGGLAHSDVFDKQAGRFIWQSIKTFAPAPQQR